MSTRRACPQRAVLVAASLCLTLLQLTNTCVALSSRDCKADVKARQARGEQICGEPLCGYLEVDQTNQTFLDRMSLECQALMWSYRDDTSPVLGVTGAASRICATAKEASDPSNPVVIETEEVNNFMICTVPRAASTNLRLLLNMLIKLPEEPRPNTIDQHWDAHYDVYPTLWHYRMDSHPAYDVYPSFIISRNPYTRLLSAFLGKMTIAMGEPGYWTAKNVNAALNMPPTKTWQATQASFHEFVMALRRRKHGVAHMDPHFRLGLRACSYGVRYEYYLRIEDLAKWLPCVEDGLELRRFTQTGWLDTEAGVMHAGAAAAGADSCWWSPPGMSCSSFYERMVNGAGKAVPVETGETRDDDWRAFYTQRIGDIVHKLYEEDFVAFGYGRQFFE